MGYAIIGFGAIGQALAGAFARIHIEVAVASRRPPEALATQAQADPHVTGGRRVVFLSSDDASAAAPVAALAETLGFAPVNLGRLEEGGALVQARADKTWGPLIFQDLFKKEP